MEVAMKMKYIISFFLFFVITILAVGCSEQPKGLELYITSETIALNSGIEKKPEAVTKLVVTLSGLEVHRIAAGEESGWMPLTPPSESIDLMSLNNIEKLISSTEITDGSYNLIRFLIDSAIVTTESGTYDATVPSSKIDVSVKFDIISGDMTIIVLAADPSASLVITGGPNPKYLLKPVLKIKKVTNPTDNGDDDIF
jgi:hypothetical protein